MGAQKEGYLQLRASDGSWHPVRVVLRATKLEILALSKARRAGDSDEQDVSLGFVPNAAVREAAIHKAAGQTPGISVVGGSDDALPVLVSAVQRGSPADRGQSVFVGDRILRVRRRDAAAAAGR